MPRNDFNGDGFSDILWRHTNGAVTNWLNNGTGGFAGNHQNAMTGVPLDWTIAGTGDFNGDEITDVLWRNSNGVVTDWLGTASGGFQANHANAMTAVPLNWTVVGTGDFNGDGLDDVLWRDSTGVVTNWLGAEDGSFVANHDNAMTAVPLAWGIAGIGDFNGDGRDDVLWQGYDHITNWLSTAEGGFVANHDAAMTKMRVPVVAVGDFNGDHRDDIVIVDDWSFYSSYAARADGSFDFSDYNPFADATSVQIVDVGDYNHDGLDDLLLRNSGSQLSVLSGTASGVFTAAPPLAADPPMWHMQPNHGGYWDT